MENSRRSFLKKAGLGGLVLGLIGVNIADEIKLIETNEIPNPIQPGVYKLDKGMAYVTDKMVHVSQNDMDYYAYSTGVERLVIGEGVRTVYKDLLNINVKDY